MNSITISGRTTAEPRVTYGENNLAIASFDIADNIKRKGNEQTLFLHCSAFRSTAEFIQQYVPKGTKVMLTGQLVPNDYTNKEGVQVHSVQMNVEHVEIMESKSSQAQPATQQAPAQNNQMPVQNQMPPMPSMPQMPNQAPQQMMAQAPAQNQMPPMPPMNNQAVPAGGTFMPGNVPAGGFAAAAYPMDTELPFN